MGRGKDDLTVVGRAEMRRVDCSRKDWAVGMYGIFPTVFCGRGGCMLNRYSSFKCTQYG